MSSIQFCQSACTKVKLHPDQPLIAQDSETKLILQHYGISSQGAFSEEPAKSSIHFPIDEPFTISDFYFTRSWTQTFIDAN